jgi:hypothetical protein
MPSPTSKAWVARVIPWVRSFATARAPGGKAGHDSLSIHRTSRRLVAFSDAAFAMLALAWLAASKAQAVKRGSVPATPV